MKPAEILQWIEHSVDTAISSNVSQVTAGIAMENFGSNGVDFVNLNRTLINHNLLKLPICPDELDKLTSLFSFKTEEEAQSNLVSLVAMGGHSKYGK